MLASFITYVTFENVVRYVPNTANKQFHEAKNIQHMVKERFI